MSPRSTVVLAAAIAAALPFATQAQAPAADGITASAAVTGLAQLDTDLDAGGSFNWASGLASASLGRQLTPELAAGMRLQYDYQHWSFSDPKAFGGSAPWGSLNLPSLGVSVTYAPAPDLRFTVAPAVEWAYESGAGTGDALMYGAVLSAAKVFSPDLVLGLGAGVFRQLDETKVFPFLVVNWKIDDRLRLTNPFQAGPVGGAGLELVYTMDAWEFGGGGTYRSYQFRLKDDGPTPGGIGEHRFVPLFLRAGRTLAPGTRLDFYAAAFLGGRLSVLDASGNERYATDYATAPAFGLTLSHRF
jgi:hypothetical protein